MKKYSKVLGILVFISLYSCTEEASAPFVPQITAFWHEENKDDHTFVFSSENEGSSQGTFTGSEDYPDSNFFGAELSGTFNNRDIDFTIERPTGNFRYYGKITADNRMELNSNAGKIVVVR
jgi:hypothetical protein